MSWRYATGCSGDRVQSESMCQVSPRHPGRRMQAALGGQLALDRDDHSPAVDIGETHLVDRRSTGEAVSTPTHWNDDDGGPRRVPDPGAAERTVGVGSRLS